jgi:hypothetical protein
VKKEKPRRQPVIIIPLEATAITFTVVALSAMSFSWKTPFELIQVGTAMLERCSPNNHAASAALVLTEFTIRSEVGRTKTFRNIEDAESSTKWISDHRAFPDCDVERGHKYLASLRCIMSYGNNDIIDQIMDLNWWRNTRLAVKHNFSIGLWKNETDRPISPPLGTQPKDLCIVRSGNVNVIDADHDTIDFS